MLPCPRMTLARFRRVATITLFAGTSIDLRNHSLEVIEPIHWAWWQLYNPEHWGLKETVGSSPLLDLDHHTVGGGASFHLRISGGTPRRYDEVSLRILVAEDGAIREVEVVRP